VDEYCHLDEVTTYKETTNKNFENDSNIPNHTQNSSVALEF
jgi:hypothetical protein